MIVSLESRWVKGAWEGKVVPSAESLMKSCWKDLLAMKVGGEHRWTAWSLKGHFMPSICELFIMQCYFLKYLNQILGVLEPSLMRDFQTRKVSCAKPPFRRLASLCPGPAPASGRPVGRVSGKCSLLTPAVQGWGRRASPESAGQNKELRVRFPEV